jgi:hypothetical protein
MTAAQRGWSGSRKGELSAQQVIDIIEFVT